METLAMVYRCLKQFSHTIILCEGSRYLFHNYISMFPVCDHHKGCIINYQQGGY